jgi:acyl-CoA synthetase (AMP-forming)/AMP-acid ligase II
MTNDFEGRAKVLWHRWVKNAEKTPDRDAIIYWKAGEQPFRWTFSALIGNAQVIAGSLIERGIKKGDVCAIILRQNRNIYPLYLAISSIGAIPAILAYPNPRLHPVKFREGIEGMTQRSGLDWIFTERDLDATIRPTVERPNSTIRGLHFPLEWARDACAEARKEDFEDAKSSDPALLQHSSGTTGLQKPVLLSHHAVLQHVQSYAQAIELNDDDKIVSWLPLYHDMGLIAAFHLPLAFGIPSVQLDPFEWVVAPSILLEAVMKERGTVSWLPNFALNLMADKIAEDELDGINLESWRLIINCSEPIRNESQQKFLDRFRSYGLRKTALSSCYAMAETTFAATQTPPGREPSCVGVNRRELARGNATLVNEDEPARSCVSSGTPIPGCEIRIVDENRVQVEAGKIGEIAIKSISLFEGYRNYPDKTAEVLSDGWYYSGDKGFNIGEEYFIIGRKKDTIIVAGNNICPEDVEDVVGTVPHVIPGRVVAFGEDNETLGSEQISVIAETEILDQQRRKKLRLDIIKAGMSIDVTVANIYLVPPRWLIKSSAGKPSRSANKDRIQMEPVLGND